MARFRWAALVAAVALVAPVLPACSRTASIEEVFTALDGGGERRRERFTTDSKGVFCVVSYTAARPGATLEVIIRQTQLANGEGTNKVLVAVESAPGVSKNVTQAAVQFQGLDETTGQLPQEQDFPIPAGTYRCEARLDGELGGFADFRVDFADCPVAIIGDQSSCKGYYDVNRKCPKYGATSNIQRYCVCVPDGYWSCEK